MPHWAIEILSYFVANRHAADSLDGIVRWRLAELLTQRHVADVEAALIWLVRGNYLIEESVVTADPIFRLNVERLPEADALLRRCVSGTVQTPDGTPAHNGCRGQ